MSPEIRHWLLLAAGTAGYFLLLAGNPLRASLRDGFRCLQRYPALWTIPGAFGFFYALFHLGLRLLERDLLREGERPIFQWSRAWFFPHAMQVEGLKASILPAFESAAGIFNNVITTFPLSAAAALLLLVNWKGHHMVLNRALRKRYGRWGWLLYGIISACAVAAVAKPLMYAGLPMLARIGPGLYPVSFTLSFVVDWLSFVFEYLFGVCIQIYLILLVYVWVRGLHASSSHLLDFAIRRFSSVMKWAALVVLLSSILIHLPLILSTVPPFSTWTSGYEVFRYVNRVARPLLAVFLLCFTTPQIVLTFHSESFRQAVRDHFCFMRKNAGTMSWFIVVASVSFFAFQFLNHALKAGLGEGTAMGILWSLSAPLIETFIAGWLLASWVCVYKRADTGRSQEEDWVAF